MTVEAIIALATGALALGNSIWAHKRITAKVQAPVTKAELYGTAEETPTEPGRKRPPKVP